MGNQQATDIEIGWLAGIVDGEGWLGMTVQTEHWYRVGFQTRQKSIKVELQIVNCDPAIIERSASILRKLGINPYLRHGNRNAPATKRPIYQVSTKHMVSVERVLLILRDHLTGTKQLRADLLLQFIHLRKTNPGAPNPAYADGSPGRKGPRTIRPYTVEELEIVERCRALQDRSGASEATRENAAATLHQMKERVARD